VQIRVSAAAVCWATGEFGLLDPIPREAMTRSKVGTASKPTQRSQSSSSEPYSVARGSGLCGEDDDTCVW
jgi:hypothetical protein